MHVGRPAHRSEIGDLPLIGSVRVHHPDVGDQTRFVEAPPHDLLAVGREKRTSVVAGNGRQPTLPRSIGAHDVDFGEVARIGVELFLFFLRQLTVVGVAHRGEGDPLTVRRVAAFGIVPSRLGQAFERASLLAVCVDVHLGVVIPCVAPLLARRPERELVFLILLRFRIGMSGGELNLVRAGPKEGARRLADSRRNAFRIARH